MVKRHLILVVILLLVSAKIVELVHKGQDAGNSTTSPIMPWKVGIFYAKDAKDKETSYICTGSILGTHWILTAAHCIQAAFRIPGTGKDEEIIRPVDGEPTGVKITISYGSNNIPIFDSQRGREFKGEMVSLMAVLSQTVFIHPEYDWNNSKTSDHDIGLIYVPNGIERIHKLWCTAPLDMSSDETSNTLKDGSLIRIAGWGRTDPYTVIKDTTKPDNFSNYLRYADINAYTGPTCVTQFPSDEEFENGIKSDAVMQKMKEELPGVIRSLTYGRTRFCGNDPNVKPSDIYRAGTCKGDSGGSVDLKLGMVESDGKKCCTFQTIGLASKGYGCGDKRFPDIYQLLSANDINWIKNTDAIIRQNPPPQELQVMPPPTAEPKWKNI